MSQKAAEEYLKSLKLEQEAEAEAVTAKTVYENSKFARRSSEQKLLSQVGNDVPTKAWIVGGVIVIAKHENSEVLVIDPESE